MKRSFDIVVVGAGPVGAAVAIGAAAMGYSVALVDAGEPVHVPAPDAEVDPRVYAISEGSRRLLEELGVWQEIAALRVSPYRRMEVFDELGAVQFDAADVAAAQLGHIIENRVVQGVLQDRAAGIAKLHFFSAERVEDLGAAADLRSVRLSTSGRLRARLVIAADGARSPVREMAGLESCEVDHEQTALVAHVRTEYAHGETARQRFLSEGPLAFLPLADGRSSIVWSTSHDHAEALLGMTAEEFDRELTGASGHWLGAVRRDSELAAFPLVSRHAPEYLAERLVLLGDAAHTVHPLAGLGLNLGLADVAALLKQLEAAREAGQDPGERSYLRRYERDRKPQNRVMLQLLHGCNELFRFRRPVVDPLRGLGMRLFNASGPLKREIIRRAMEV